MLENNVSSLKKISIEAVQKQNLKYKTGSTSTKCFHAHKYRNKARPQVTRVMQPTQQQVAPYAHARCNKRSRNCAQTGLACQRCSATCCWLGCITLVTCDQALSASIRAKCWLTICAESYAFILFTSRFRLGRQIFFLTCRTFLCTYKCPLRYTLFRSHRFSAMIY